MDCRHGGKQHQQQQQQQHRRRGHEDRGGGDRHLVRGYGLPWLRAQWQSMGPFLAWVLGDADFMFWRELRSQHEEEKNTTTKQKTQSGRVKLNTEQDDDRDIMVTTKEQYDNRQK